MKRVNSAVWMEKYSRWQINVQVDGVRRSFTSAKPGRTGQREANAKADAWLDDGIVNASQRVDALLGGYIEDLKARTSHGHWRNEESRCRIWIAPHIGQRKISTIHDQDLQTIINNGYQGGLSRKSLLDLRATISAFLKYCRKCKTTAYHPENIIIPASATVKIKSILQPDDIVKLFHSHETLLYGVIRHDDLIHAYRFQVLTGLRPGELLGLMWSHMDGRRLMIQQSKNNYSEMTHGKNRNAIRTIPLTDSALAILYEQRDECPDSLFIFPPVTQNCYRKRWQRYCAHNHITRTTPYELRHTFVSVAQSLPEAYVKPMVGHSKNMDTFGVYGHTFGGQMDDASRQLNAIFQDILLSSTGDESIQNA